MKKITHKGFVLIDNKTKNVVGEKVYLSEKDIGRVVIENASLSVQRIPVLVTELKKRY